MADEDIKRFVVATTFIFLIAPVFVLIYIIIYNKRKKRHAEEKAQMKLAFEEEIARTQLEAQEQTMQTIGADLHDNIGQLLSLTTLMLNSISFADELKARKKVDSAIDLTMRSMQEMRLLGKLLQGEQLISEGLAGAIDYEARWLEKSGGFAVVYQVEGELPKVSNPDKDLVIFRIAQETLNNIMKHAQASRIGIKLMYTELSVQLQVNDNGLGFEAGEPSIAAKGMGLQNIKRRAGIVGGEALIRSNPGGGTCVDVFIPYP